MTNAAALVVSLALTNGCATYNESRRVAKAGGYVMLTGAAVGLLGGLIGVGNRSSFSGSGAYGAVGVALLGATLLTLGAVIGVPGLIGMGTYAEPQSKEARTAAESRAVRDRQVREAQARERAVSAPVRERCLQDRAESLRDAATIVDLRVRARTLQSIPTCPGPAATETRERARVLTQTAAAAARSADCEPTRRLGPQVAALDADFHRTVFLADVAIRRCVEPAVAPPPVTPAPAP